MNASEPRMLAAPELGPTSPSGIEVPVKAGPDAVHPERIGEPGGFPFTRGIFTDGFRGRLWTIRQYSGFGSAEESNERYRFLFDQGQTGLSVALDLPTQCGLDPMARPEIGLPRFRRKSLVRAVRAGRHAACHDQENQCRYQRAPAGARRRREIQGARC